jgi:hypothetical protein
LECDVVIRVWSLEQSLKDHKVVPRQEPALRDVCDAKESSELRTTDTRQVALGRDSIDELFTVQKPGTTHNNATAFSIKGSNKEKRKLRNIDTHLSPSTRDFAFASKVRRQRFISDSGTRTALLTDWTTRAAAVPSESACTMGKESGGGDVGDAMDLVN